jgi:rubredoxin
MSKPQICPECNASMEEGATLDLESRRTQTWLRGPVEEKRLTGIKTRGKELLPVVSYRCPMCGYLKTFAPPV